MEKLIFELLATYGVDGFMAVAMVFIVIRFDHRIAERDKEDLSQRKELVAIIKNNTEAMTGLKIVVENLWRRN